PICFKRIPAKDIIKERFQGKPSWIMLKEDKALGVLEEHEFPGSVLVKLGFGPMEDYLRFKDTWDIHMDGYRKKDCYELRVQLYQVGV
ncbi:unnamed protein product, partial [Discosporangium mesarthrocarpum]